VPLKVAGSQTLAREEEDLLVQWEERERQLTAMARLWKTARPGSSSSGASTNLSLLSLLLLSPSPGLSGSSPGPSSGPNHWNWPDL